MAGEVEAYFTDIEHKGDFGRNEGSGNLRTISGKLNLKESLFRRLCIEPGSVPHRPDYGVGIKSYRGALATIPKKRELALKINDQFLRDPRVQEVLGVAVESDDLTPETTKITVRVKPVGYDEISMEFVPFGGELE